MFTTPAGSPAWIRNSPRVAVVHGGTSESVTRAVQPAASAKGSFWLTIRNGKFHGPMMDTTPTGSISAVPIMSLPRLLRLAPACPRSGAVV